VIAALTTPSAIAAKVATATIPIVFTTIGDPMQIGLVASLSRPGGNLTGVTILNVEIVPKMLELLHQVVPTATTTAVLVNPTNPNAETLSTSLQVAARTLGLELNVLRASTERAIDKPFATLIPLRVGGLTRNRLRTGGKPSARLSPPIWRAAAQAQRYTHRVAISNRRLIACDERGVTFKYKGLSRPRPCALQAHDPRNRRGRRARSPFPWREAADQKSGYQRDPLSPDRGYHADRSATRTHKFGTIAIVKIASQLETHF
jgi:hypothetical protein